MDQRPTSSGLRAYTQRLRFALYAQLIVAGIAVVAVIYSGVTINQHRIERDQIISDKNDAIKARDNAQTATVEAVDRLNLAREITDILAQTSDDIAAGRFELAESDLLRAREQIPLDEEIASELEQQTWRRFTRTISNTLVNVRTRMGAYDLAIEDLSALLDREESDAQEKMRLQFELAGVHCLNNDANAARALIDQDTFDTYKDNQILTGSFDERCGTLLSDMIAPPEPASDPARMQTSAMIRGMPADRATAGFEIGRLFVHVRREDQRAAAEQVSEVLCRFGYNVPGIEVVAEPRGYPSRAQIVHYYPEQDPEISALATVLEAVVGGISADWQATPFRTPVFERDGLRKDTAEVWLPDFGGANGQTPIGPRFSCEADVPERADLVAESDESSATLGLVSQLNASDSAARVAAGQQVADLVRSDDNRAVLDALIQQLEDPQALDALSPSGRFNVLYMLNLQSSWTDVSGLSPRLASALEQIEARQANGVSIGSQTGSCIQSLKDKLSGEAASDRCGGR